MSIVLVLVLLGVVAAIAVVAAGRGDALGDAEPERSPSGTLPEGPVDRAAVDGLRFTLAVRGYRMDEVDAALDRLVGELEARDRRIAELEASDAREV
jgi:DivIVA domain-containing protein